MQAGEEGGPQRSLPSARCKLLSLQTSVLERSPVISDLHSRCGFTEAHSPPGPCSVSHLPHLTPLLPRPLGFCLKEDHRVRVERRRGSTGWSLCSLHSLQRAESALVRCRALGLSARGLRSVLHQFFPTCFSARPAHPCEAGVATTPMARADRMLTHGRAYRNPRHVWQVAGWRGRVS